MQGHSGAVLGVAVTPDGKRAISASIDKTVKVWHLETGRNLCTLKGHAAPVHGVAVAPGGIRAVSASADQALKLWDIDTGVLITTFRSEGSALCCAFAAERRIVAGDEAGRVYFLALED